MTAYPLTAGRDINQAFGWRSQESEVGVYSGTLPLALYSRDFSLALVKIEMGVK